MNGSHSRHIFVLFLINFTARWLSENFDKKKKNSLVAPGHNHPCTKAVLRTKNNKKKKEYFVFWRQNEEAEKLQEDRRKTKPHINSNIQTKKNNKTNNNTEKKELRTTHFTPLGLVSFHFILYFALSYTPVYLFIFFSVQMMNEFCALDRDARKRHKWRKRNGRRREEEEKKNRRRRGKKTHTYDIKWNKKMKIWQTERGEQMPIRATEMAQPHSKLKRKKKRRKKNTKWNAMYSVKMYI